MQRLSESNQPEDNSNFSKDSFFFYSHLNGFGIVPIIGDRLPKMVKVCFFFVKTGNKEIITKNDYKSVNK